jgi:beta-glucosidase
LEFPPYTLPPSGPPLPRDAFVGAWLPGTEGQGMADVLFGDDPFIGKLPYTWPKSMDQVPFNPASSEAPLFPYGYGLGTNN